MSYLVLARKYRPQTFEEIVGQEHVTRTLANAFAKGRVHHAFLFCGARGVGKTTAARVLAKALCCEKGPTPTPCGTCEACKSITAGTAVDYFEIDGASNNGVDDIRELRDGVRYQPAQLKRKIYVIDEVHMLSVAAFNALLKTLEEPPPHVTFIFATTEVHKIPITILSRTQRYDFKLVPVPRLVAHLTQILAAEQIPVDKGALQLLAREAGGSVRDALSLADQVIAYAGGEPISEAKVAEVLGVADRALLADLARAVLGGNAAGSLAAVDAAVERGVDLAHLARSFLGLLRDLAVIAEVKDSEGLVEATPDERKMLADLAQTASRPQLASLFDRFARACEELSKSQTPRLILDVALLDMAASEPLIPVGEMIDRLEQLERRLRSGGPAPAASAGPAATATPPRRPMGAAPAPSAPASVAVPPAPSAKPAPPTPTTYRAPDDSMAEWERFIGFLEKRSMMLASVYAHGRLLSWDERAVELGFAAGSLQANLGSDTETLTSLKKHLSDFASAPLDVRVKVLQGLPTPTAKPAPGAAPAAPAPQQGGRALVEVEADRRADHRSRREEEARAHPSTKAVIDTFGAQIKEIKIDG